MIHTKTVNFQDSSGVVLHKTTMMDILNLSLDEW